ncbi:747_t:CDS:2 [Cetraspora pellucida]|uniref:747_t:CDS:1 n=1 Tax=Cetraspora pellucida TaxID=1433469 RepID=A0A9N9I207_9GLOM|nr:747_t:CDS:2 [Cetraspora pellucida]
MSRPTPVFLYDKFMTLRKSFEDKTSASKVLRRKKIGRLIDTGRLLCRKWYLYSKQLDPSKIACYKLIEKNPATKLILSEQKKIIHVYDDQYQFLYSTESIHEAATRLALCPTLIKFHLKKTKPLMVKSLDRIYYIVTNIVKIKRMNTKKRVKYLKDANIMSPSDVDVPTDVENKETSDDSENLSLPEPEFFDSIRRFASDHYTNSYKLPEIFGQMDESALLTMGVLLQEYIGNILSDNS